MDIVVEQPWSIHPRELDREIFEDGPFALE